jgi:hypothetical protein
MLGFRHRHSDFITVALVTVALIAVALIAVALIAVTLEFSSPYRISLPSSLYNFVTLISSPLLLHFLAVLDFITNTFVPLYGMPCSHCY